MNSQELGIGVVAFNPLGKGFFASGSNISSKFGDNDFRKVSKFIFTYIKWILLTQTCTGIKFL